MSSLQGINGTIFMYGQTGSGKTFTMLGSHNFGEEEENEIYQQQNKKSTHFKIHHFNLKRCKIPNN